MSLARAFTTRRVKNLQTSERDGIPQRSNTTVKSSVGSIRSKISAPMELIHTTNMLAYNAPDLHLQTASSASSIGSDDGMTSDSAGTSASSPPTSPDVPPQRSMTPEPNHLSCYFTAPGQAPVAKPAMSALKPSPSISRQQPPIIPQRSPSHTKKASLDALNRHRSVSRNSEQSARTLSTKASFSFSRSSSASSSTTATTYLPTPGVQQQHFSKVSSTQAGPSSPTTGKLAPPPVFYYQNMKEQMDHPHPFGQELAQVREIAEEYGINEPFQAVDEETQHMEAHGLFKFTAQDYLFEIQCFSVDRFDDIPQPQPLALWI
ncbi:hypothetical protein DL546_001213 [Coniochaeta pulveracea]|uniref:Uncharacterized protein n=1 Tax=Coniochaeta pulveracea TaxID=177199 RepID=A0A420Y2K5_9PEZI|nr:hypothetical protein DL546_001213 [Coniochaeta pulveracea]